MPPGSQMKRKQRAVMERGVDKRKFTKYQTTVTLAEEHDGSSNIIHVHSSVPVA